MKVNTVNKRIEFVQKCLHAYGQAMSNDWGDFDGRACQSTLDEISSFLNENKFLPTFEQWLDSECIVLNEDNEFVWDY